MTDSLFRYENARRVIYGDSGAQFVPVCEKCGRFVKADSTIGLCKLDENLSPEPNATCSKCGRTHMLFEGFIA